MKYPKPFEAGRPAGPTYVGSFREGPRAGQIQVATYVNRPGTPDHTRLIRAWLSVAEAEKLRDELTHHIDMMRRREAEERMNGCECVEVQGPVPECDTHGLERQR